MNNIIIGIGNPDRQDDGAAWHVLLKVAEELKVPIPDSFSTGFIPQNQPVDLMSLLQLTPEIAEEIAWYDRIFFVDAHTADQAEDLAIQKVEPCFQHSPLTHHFTPQSCMDLVHTLYQREPESWLVSIKGHLFEFENTLSSSTSHGVDLAVEWILEQIKQEKS